jgi:hypothetical protein
MGRLRHKILMPLFVPEFLTPALDRDLELVASGAPLALHAPMFTPT